PFTFTSLNDDSYLQFVIKSYPSSLSGHKGLTEQIGKLEKGDSFIVKDPWGTISYKGPGVFLAGGAGITPFIAIFRELYEEGNIDGNRLIFSNKTADDVILEDEFNTILGNNFTSVLTDEPQEGHLFLDGFVDKEFLEEQIDDFNQPFYVCGPPPFMDAILGYLKEVGADHEGLVFEEEVAQKSLCWQDESTKALLAQSLFQSTVINIRESSYAEQVFSLSPHQYPTNI